MRILVGLTLPMLLVAANTLFAAAYPERSIRIIVPYAPGGNIDITARIIARFRQVTRETGTPIFA